MRKSTSEWTRSAPGLTASDRAPPLSAPINPTSHELKGLRMIFQRWISARRPAPGDSVTDGGQRGASWRRRLLAGVIGLVAIVAGMVAAPSPASAATSCSGYGCDGHYPDQTQCWNDRYIVYGQHLTWPDGSQSATIIQLWYSPSCQTTWAYLVNGHPRNPDDAGCTATIHREWDLSYTEPVDPGITFAYTKMVYDGGRYSYASGYCDTGVGISATGSTPAW